VSAKKRVPGGKWAARRRKAMRFHLIGVPGRVVRLAPRPIVRLPAGFLDLNRDARPAKLCLRPAPRGCAALGSGFSRSFEAVFPGVLFPGVLRRGGAIPWLLRARVARRVDDSSSKLEYSVKKRDTNSYKKEVVHQKKQNMRTNFETFEEESKNRSKTLGHRIASSRLSGTLIIAQATGLCRHASKHNRH
jgi:hypothetical protein